jgi:hypothetical protein
VAAVDPWVIAPVSHAESLSCPGRSRCHHVPAAPTDLLAGDLVTHAVDDDHLVRMTGEAAKAPHQTAARLCYASGPASSAAVTAGRRSQVKVPGPRTRQAALDTCPLAKGSAAVSPMGGERRRTRLAATAGRCPAPHKSLGEGARQGEDRRAINVQSARQSTVNHGYSRPAELPGQRLHRPRSVRFPS